MPLPTRLQARILAWVGETATATEGDIPVALKATPSSSRVEPAEDAETEIKDQSVPLSSCLSSADVFSLSDEAAAAGSPCVVVKDGFLGREDALLVHKAALELEGRGHMKPGGMGRGDSIWHNSQSRGDSTLWITDGVQGSGELPEALEALLSRLNALRSPLNAARVCSGSLSSGLGLVGTTSVQLARYPGDGRGYVHHRDTPESARDSEEADRKITALYYLNPGWEAAMGGQLRIHLDPPMCKDGSPQQGEGHVCSGQTWDIEPLLDRLVVFRSDVVDHEVMPCFAPRLAVTLWLYGRNLGGISATTRALASATNCSAPSATTPDTARKDVEPGDDTRSKVRPLPTIEGEAGRHAAEASIFVSIVSYRDPETNPTILDLFARASNPRRVSVGLVWQLNLDVAEDDNMRRSTPATGSSNVRGGRVRSLLMPAADAAGPSWARRAAQTLWKGEKYFLQIDSHTRFRPGWDSYLIRTLQRCPSFKPVITTYPVGYQLPNKIPAGETRPTLLVPEGFGPDGMLRQTGRLMLRTARDPLPSALWASGFSFSSSALLIEVPYDPGLRHAFFGEEISMAARMYTRGWDCFAPPQTVVYHLWSRTHRPSFRQVSTPEAEAEEAQAKRRLRTMLGVGMYPPRGAGAGGDGCSGDQGEWGGLGEGDGDSNSCVLPECFGLGTARTLKSFEERVGVDLRTSTLVSADAKNAGRPSTDFNDSIATGLEGVLGILGKVGMVNPKSNSSNSSSGNSSLRPSAESGV